MKPCVYSGLVGEVMRRVVQAWQALCYPAHSNFGRSKGDSRVARLLKRTSAWHAPLFRSTQPSDEVPTGLANSRAKSELHKRECLGDVCARSPL
jgi:hypothetical protein